MTEPESFDLASLEAFTSGLVAAGFEPMPGSDRRWWSGPIHPAFHGLTAATRMRIVIRDGWPYVSPVLFVEGVDANHLTEHGLVCLWDDDDASMAWLTVDGFFARASEWCDRANGGWDERGLGRDAYLNFSPKHATVASFDLDTLDADNPGSWGSFHGTVRNPGHIELEHGVGGLGALKGLWVHVGSLDVPPRNLDQVRGALNRTQRKGLDRALGQRRDAGVGERSRGVDLILFRWDRLDTRHLLVLGLTGSGESIEAHALQAGPNDRESLLLRAGPDAATLLTKSIVVFGVGAVGGHTAVCLAASGVGLLRLVDADQLLPGNAVRHVVGHTAAGAPKVYAVATRIKDHAPWAEVEPIPERPRGPSRLRELAEGADLVVDATGSEPMTQALALVAADLGQPFVSAALYRGGAIARVQRQSLPTDTPLASRPGTDGYEAVPPADDVDEFLDAPVGCSAPVNNAPPSCVLACAALTAQVVIDALAGRNELPDELTDIYRGLPGEPPFDRLGRLG